MKTTLFSSIFCLLFLSFAEAQNSLRFDNAKFDFQTQELNGKTLKVRAYEKIVYVANPVDLNHQTLNIYIPEEYFNGGNINGYTAETAPIFFPNRVGGYMPAFPATFLVQEQKNERFPNDNKTILTALSKGYIVASAGARGRINKNEKGEFTGKAPAGIVDLKAAIRYLKFNDKIMAGDANKIISNGTSAGGAMSSLLGATGNHPDYESFLKEIGAANATDDIFAVSAYCPIINLENADAAYEWQLNKEHKYNFRGKVGILDADAIKISDDLKAVFPKYLTSLNLKDSGGKILRLDDSGNGSFKELIKIYLMASAQKAFDNGEDLSKHSFLEIQNKKIISIDFDTFMAYLERMKIPPAFDALDNSAPENQLFGNSSKDKRHFTNYALQHSKDPNATRADPLQIKMMNPMNYIGANEAKSAQNWRIRHGAKDRDTGFAISVILATRLQNKAYQIDFALPWDKPHSGDYDLDELFTWIDATCKK